MKLSELLNEQPAAIVNGKFYYYVSEELQELELTSEFALKKVYKNE